VLPRLVVFSAGWNCEKYVGKCLRSIYAQTYKNYIHVVVDDASTDGTYSEILKYKSDKTVVYRNKKNIKWLNNAVKYLDLNIESEEDVIAIIDLDDWLIGTDVFRKVSKAYDRKGAWVTYGQCSCPLSGKKKRIRPAGATPEILKARDFRNSAWVFTHLQTFKAFLWNAIDKKDFLGPDGKYVLRTYDRALMYPILEMTLSDKICFMEGVVYFYNQGNPLCNFRIHRLGQDKEVLVSYKKWFRSRPRYGLLKR